MKQLLIYPPGKGGLPINTEDYLCLAQDQFLNDVIIDFYLKYLVLNLPKEQQEKVHVFSTFFYKRLTTKPIKASRYDCLTKIWPNIFLHLFMFCFNFLSILISKYTRINNFLLLFTVNAYIVHFTKKYRLGVRKSTGICCVNARIMLNNSFIS